jgi:phosphate transport system permease protein
LPIVISLLIAQQFAMPGATALVAVFVPLQLLAAGASATFVGGRRGIPDAVLTVIVLFLVLMVAIVLGSVLLNLIRKGIHALSIQFLFYDSTYVTSSTSLDYGGVFHAIVGTILVVGLAALVTIPLGIGVGVFLTETRSPMRGPVRFITQSMTGLPSIVAGLFIFAFFVLSGFSKQVGWLGSAALLLLMLPTVARLSEEVLKLVPQDLRGAAMALGAPRNRAFFQVVLPAARSGIITAVLLGLARIVGETAPLLMTTIPGDATNFNPFSGLMSTLPTYIYKWVSAGSEIAVQRAWGAALVLLILVGMIFTLARVFGKQKF